MTLKMKILPNQSVIENKIMNSDSREKREQYHNQITPQSNLHHEYLRNQYLAQHICIQKFEESRNNHNSDLILVFLHGIQNLYQPTIPHYIIPKNRKGKVKRKAKKKVRQSSSYRPVAFKPSLEPLMENDPMINTLPYLAKEQNSSREIKLLTCNKNSISICKNQIQIQPPIWYILSSKQKYLKKVVMHQCS